MFQFTAWTVLPAAAVVFSLIAYWRAGRRTNIPGSRAIQFIFICAVCWSAPLTLETMLVSEPAKLLAMQISTVGIALMAVAWFQFSITYCQRTSRINRKLLNVVCILPLTTLGIVFSNDYHHLYWQSWSLVETSWGINLWLEPGPWLRLQLSYSVILIVAATAILCFELTRTQRYSAAIWAGISPGIVLVTKLFSISPYNPIPAADYTVISFVIAGLLLERVMMDKGVLERLPVARDRVFELLKDPVLVVDHNGVIVDANHSATLAWRPEKGSLIDTSTETILEHLPLSHVVNNTQNPEVTIGQSTYEVSATTLDKNNPDADITLLFRDVTSRRKAERQLRDMTHRLELMAHTDALTNLFNRRYFMQRLGEELERVKRHPGYLSVLILDLDHFKKINDTFGHDAGDAVLEAVATVANQVKRVTDVACRLGGEEFALLLPETDKQGAIKMAQRLREGIERYPYSDLLSLPLQVTASIGVSTISDTTPESDNILKIADRALYDAKENGRNMVCFKAA